MTGRLGALVADTALATYLDHGFSLFPVWGLRPGKGNERVCACPAGPNFVGAKFKKHAHGKHPHKLVPNGFRNASRDKAIINQWARQARGCNWGLAAGEPLPGGGFLLVLDEDPRNGGDDTLAAILGAQGPLPAGPVQETGGDGRHYFLRTDRPLASFSIGPGLETKGAGGYVCVEPSAHSSGGCYAWRIGFGLEDVRIPDAPDWLVEAASGESRARPVREGEGTARDTILGEAFALSGRLGVALPDGNVAVNCPWSAEHSDGRGIGEDSSTVILPPAGGSLFGGFSCKHGHCTNRKWTDVIAALPPDAVAAARRKFPITPALCTAARPSADLAIVGDVDLATAKKAVFARLDGGETKNGWKPSKTSVNVMTILRYDPRWDGVIVYDEFSQVIRYRSAPPWHDDDKSSMPTKVWRDSDATRLGNWLLREYQLDIPAEKVYACVVAHAESHAANPVTEWLNGLRWDGVKRLDNWLDHLGVAPTAYTKSVGAKWMISAVARAYAPGCKVDTLIIFEGPQGRGKSSALRVLMPLPEWFSDTPFCVGNKDAYLSLHGKWVIELGELASLSKAEVEKVKAFFSSASDYYRPPYGRSNVDMPRRCVFAGTTNADAYLKDSTGNRRYFPITCGVIDLEGLKAARDQLWAEAAKRYRDGEYWWPSLDEAEIFKAEQEKRETVDTWTGKVQEWLLHVQQKWNDADTAAPTAPVARYVTVEEALLALGVAVADLDASKQTRMGIILRRTLNWKRVRIPINGERTWVYAPPSQVGQ